MGIITNIKNYFKKQEPKQGSPFGNNFSSLLRGISKGSREVNAANVSWVFACIEKRAKLTADVQYHIYKDKDNIDDKHPLNELLIKSNNVFNQSFKDLVYLIQSRLDFFGNAYIWARPNNAGNGIIDLLPIMTNNVTIKADNQKYNAVYEFNINGNKVSIKGDEIIHFKTIGIPTSDNYAENHFMGIPKILNSIKNVMEAHKEMIEYIEGYFENDTIPPMVYHNPESFTDDQWSRFQENYYNGFGTATRKPKLLLAEGGGEYKPMDVSTNTLNSSVFKEGLDNNIANQICTAFETPKALLTNEFKYSDRNQYLQTYKNDVILPLAKYIAETFEIHFNKYYPDLILKPEKIHYSNPEERRKDFDLLAKYGAITKNELRAEFGYEELNDINETESKESKSLDDFADEKVLYNYWKKYDDVSEAFTKKFQKTLNKYFKELNEHIEQNLKNAAGKSNPKRKRFKIIDESITLIKIDDWVEILQNITGAELDSYLKDMLNLILDDININPDDFTEYENVIRDVTRDINDKMVDPPNTIDKELKKSIKEVIQQNPLDSADQRLKRILKLTKNKFDTVYTKSRSEMISRTTATGASENSRSRVLKRAGFDKVWISSRDGKVRESHAAIDKQTSDTAGYFTLAGHKCKHPADSSLPAKEAINCRCRTAAKKRDKIFINGRSYDYKI